MYKDPLQSLQPFCPDMPAKDAGTLPLLCQQMRALQILVTSQGEVLEVLIAKVFVGSDAIATSTAGPDVFDLTANDSSNEADAGRERPLLEPDGLQVALLGSETIAACISVIGAGSERPLPEPDGQQVALLGDEKVAAYL